MVTPISSAAGTTCFRRRYLNYSCKKARNLSSGYEYADYVSIVPIAAACICCHSGQPQPARDRAELFCDPAFRELPIGCENCHGPGALHVGKGETGFRERH